MMFAEFLLHIQVARREEPVVGRRVILAINEIAWKGGGLRTLKSKVFRSHLGPSERRAECKEVSVSSNMT